jgi:periplasmic protein TonB
MRKDFIIGIIISVALHAGFLFGEHLIPKRAADSNLVQLDEEEIIRMEMPPLEPDEPEKIEELHEEVVTTQLAAPSLIDMPTVIPVNAFVQPMQPPPPPGLEVARGAVSIPVTNPGANFGKDMKDLFDIKNLDQTPQARVRGDPIYPFEMRRAGLSGEVLVAFIVNTNGDVVDAYAVRSTQREFESAAVQAVSKWKFRPGKKGGRAVNTKMSIPIVFNISDQ